MAKVTAYNDGVDIYVSWREAFDLVFCEGEALEALRAQLANAMQARINDVLDEGEVRDAKTYVKIEEGWQAKPLTPRQNVERSDEDVCPKCGAVRMEDQTGPASDWCSDHADDIEARSEEDDANAKLPLARFDNVEVASRAAIKLSREYPDIGVVEDDDNEWFVVCANRRRMGITPTIYTLERTYWLRENGKMG